VKGVLGIDRMSIVEVEPFLLAHWEGIKAKLTDGSYYPLAVKRVIIPKLDGGELIQQAISQVISPYFEPIFSPHSDGYRPGKCARHALTHVQNCIKQGYKTAVDIDLSKFFDEVNHDMLMNRIGCKIKDKALMQLIGRYLRAGIAEAETGLWFPSDEGVPQGGPLSPLLSNILLDELDKKLTRERLYFARYAVDITILVKSQHIGNKVKIEISRYIRKRLKLIINETKSRVGPASGSKFLGFTFQLG
jgi:RNA-directed DNA polymerase